MNCPNCKSEKLLQQILFWVCHDCGILFVETLNNNNQKKQSIEISPELFNKILKQEQLNNDPKDTKIKDHITKTEITKSNDDLNDITSLFKVITKDTTDEN